MNSARDDSEMTKVLELFFGDRLPGSQPTVSNLRRVNSGRSRENWTFDLTWQEVGVERSEALILRRDPAGGLVDTDRKTEFAVLRCLERTAVPAPVGRWIDPDGDYFGSPSLIMRREPGYCDYYVLNGERPVEVRRRLAETFCDLLAEVHHVDIDGTGLRDVLEVPADPASQQLEYWEEVLRGDQIEPYPEVDLAVTWMRENLPSPLTPVLVHGDFKPGNILLHGGVVSAVLDWELAHIGDPGEDLGWVTQPLRKREHLIEGHWGTEQLLERYELSSGIRISDDRLRWWNLFATFRTAVMQVSGLRSYVEGRSRQFYRPTPKVLKALLDALTGSPRGVGHEA